MKETRLKEDRCLSCNYLIDAASSVDGDHIPSPGDVTICLRCGHLMAFGTDMRVRELTSDEQYAVAGDPIILKVQKARGYVMKGEKQ